MNKINEIQLPGVNDSPDLRRASLQFIGTATVLLRYAGFTLLTDPNFLHKGERINVGYGLHATRLTDPAINIEDLPPIDLVVLSHLHEDHFDRVAEQRLDKRVPIITTRQAAEALGKKGFTSTHGLDTWEALTVRKGNIELRITAMPAKHAPAFLPALLPPVIGSMLEFQSPAGETTMRLYITGDTLLYKQLHEIPRRYPEIDLALFHLGGTRIMGILLTMNGKQGAKALKIIAPHRAIPVHFNDYNVFKSPIEDFIKAVKEKDLNRRVTYLSPGELYEFEVR